MQTHLIMDAIGTTAGGKRTELLPAGTQVEFLGFNPGDRVRVQLKDGRIVEIEANRVSSRFDDD